MLAHQRPGAFALALADCVDQTMVIVVRALYQPVVMPQDDAIRRKGNVLGLQHHLVRQGAAAAADDCAVKLGVHLAVLWQVGRVEFLLSQYAIAGRQALPKDREQCRIDVSRRAFRRGVGFEN